MAEINEATTDELVKELTRRKALPRCPLWSLADLPGRVRPRRLHPSVLWLPAGDWSVPLWLTASSVAAPTAVTTSGPRNRLVMSALSAASGLITRSAAPRSATARTMTTSLPSMTILAVPVPPSDRDLAQQWLAERIDVGMSGPTQLYCEHPDWGGPACRHCIAAAILDTPGVEVTSEPAIAVEPGVQTAEGWTLQQIRGPWLVVRLPIDDKEERK